MPPTTRRHFLVGAAAGIGGIAIGAAGGAALDDHSQSNTKAIPGATALARLGSGPLAYDDFIRANGTIDGQRAPSGQIYRIDYDPRHTGLWVTDNRLERQYRAHFGRDGGSPAANLALGDAPSRIAAEFMFLNDTITPGLTLGADAVIGATRKSFKHTSVQLACYVHAWEVFLTQPNPKLGIQEIVMLATAKFPRHLAKNGDASYSMAMSRIGDTVTVQLPFGLSHQVTDPRISRYWGRQFGIQIRRNKPTDGDAAILAIAATSGTPGAQRVLRLFGNF